MQRSIYNNMKLIRQSNSWSCLPVAFAMALDCTYQEVIDAIGHDGSEIVFPALPEPERRRSFHIQELIRVAVERGYAVTPIVARPVLTPDLVNRLTLDQRDFAIKQMVGRSGVCTGRGVIRNHAVAWNGSEYLDPNGLTYPPSPAFTPEAFFRFDLIP